MDFLGAAKAIFIPYFVDLLAPVMEARPQELLKQESGLGH